MTSPAVAFRARKTPFGFEEVAPEDFAAHRGQVRLIDVREIPEFNDALGHAAGAELVPLATLPQVAESWSRDEPIAVVCRSGGRSGRGAMALIQMGFGQVYNVSGGMLGWNSAGLPVERA
jgi:rhodanese-related sulfurtransferase